MPMAAKTVDNTTARERMRLTLIPEETAYNSLLPAVLRAIPVRVRENKYHKVQAKRKKSSNPVGNDNSPNGKARNLIQ